MTMTVSRNLEHRGRDPSPSAGTSQSKTHKTRSSTHNIQDHPEFSPSEHRSKSRKSTTVTSTTKYSEGHRRPEGREQKNQMPIQRSPPTQPPLQRRNGRASSRRMSFVDSPTRRNYRNLLQHIRQLEESNSFLRSQLKSLEGSNVEEIVNLQRKHEALSRENVELNRLAEKWKGRCYRMKEKSVLFLKLRSTRKANAEMKEDLEVCRAVICRLNSELMRCQEKLGYYDEDELFGSDSSRVDQLLSQMSSSNISDPLVQKRMIPLFVSYDEVISEKNEIIKGHENALRQFKLQCKEIVGENQNLHAMIADKEEKGTVSIEEWQFLHKNASVVLEENDLLHKKVDLLENKSNALVKGYEDTVARLKEKVAVLENDKDALKGAVMKAERQCQTLLEQQARLSEILEKRIPLDQHEASVQECKILFEELKKNYASEQAILLEKIQGLEREKSKFDLEIRSAEEDNERLQTSLNACEEALASNTRQFKEVYQTMLHAVKSRDAATLVLEDTKALAQSAIEERDKAQEMLEEQRRLNHNLLQLRERQKGLEEQLKLKILELEEIHSAEVDKYVRRMAEMERSEEIVLEDQRQKLGYLERLLEEKSKRIEHLEAEKGQLSVDLETVWKTTTSSLKQIATATTPQTC